MKKLLYTFILPVLALCLIFAACEDWTEVEPKHSENMTGSIFTAEYYAALRAYKASDHPITFGWFGNWTGNGASLEKSMAGLPDSVDFISIWGNWRSLNDAQKQDLKYVQEVKGTKALMCFIVQNIGDQLTPKDYEGDYKEFWGWNDNDPAAIEAAIKKYANAICDTIDYYDYDGFDIDYEPNYGHRGNMSGNDANMLLFIQTLRNRLGTKAETGKLIVLDGEPQTIVSEAGPLIDYFIVQAYDSGGDSDLDSRLSSTISNFDGILSPEEVAKKYVVTENFEKWALSGGADFRDRYGNRMKSLEGMARWTPVINDKKCAKGGVGTYHMEYEFTISGYDGSYPYLRNATRIMNPPIK